MILREIENCIIEKISSPPPNPHDEIARLRACYIRNLINDCVYHTVYL